jgi:hypothetical protein
MMKTTSWRKSVAEMGGATAALFPQLEVQYENIID